MGVFGEQKSISKTGILPFYKALISVSANLLGATALVGPGLILRPYFAQKSDIFIPAVCGLS